MHFSATTEYPADAHVVAAMLADEDYVRRRAQATGAQEHHAEVQRDGEAFTVTTRLKMPTTMVPAKFRSFVGQTVEVRLVEAWGAPAADGTRTSTMTLAIPGVPVKVNGTQRLSANGAGSTETYDGDVNASIPLLGKKIEQLAVDSVNKVVAVEKRIALEYLAAR